jgi:hypothetical protein
MTNLTYNRQTPRYGKLNALGYDRGDFVFQGGKPDVPATAAVTTPQPTIDAAQAWAAAQGTASQVVLEDFIKRYGDSFYGTLARSRLEELKKSQAAIITLPVAPTELSATKGTFGNFALASCKGPSATIISLTGIDSEEATRHRNACDQFHPIFSTGFGS